MLVPYALVVVAYVGVRHHVLGAVTIRTPPPLLDNPLAHVDAWPRIGTAIVVLWQYVSVLALPARLSADDSFDQVPVVGSALDPRFLGAAVMLAALGISAVAVRRRAPGVARGLCFAAVAMLVTANVLFPIGTIKGERLLYLPSVGWCVACGWLVARWQPTRPALRQAVFALVLVAFAGRTWVRNADWRDELTLFTATVAASPNSARAQHNAAAVYGHAGRLDDAIAHYRQALAIYPEYRSAALGIAHAYQLAGRPAEATYWRAHAASVSGRNEPDGHALGR
jgi:tetratricopeptide (TPR) repeat protein